MDDLNKYINEQLKDTKFKKEFEVLKAIIKSKNENNPCDELQDTNFSDTQKQDMVVDLL